MLKILSIYITFILTIQWVMAAPKPAPELVQVSQLPQNIPTCSEDAHINECIRNAFNIMLRSSVKGVPDLNIPPIDPLIQDKLNVQFANNLIRGRAAVRKVHISGISTATMTNTKYKREGDKIKLMVNLHVPKIEIGGLYKAEVLLNQAKFSSKGVFNVTMVDIESKSEHYAELYERDGHTFMRLTKVDIHPTLGDMRIAATGLVPDPSLNDALVQIINQNWRPLYRNIITSTTSTWEPLLVKYSNDFFVHLPFDFLITNAKN